MYRLPPALVGVVVLVVTLLEAANVVATLVYKSGDISFHAVFLAVMTAVGLAVRPAAQTPAEPIAALPPAEQDRTPPAPADEDPPDPPRRSRHRGAS